MTTKTAPVSKSTRAGLQFPVGRIHGHMKRMRKGLQTSSTASVAFAAVLEYTLAELFDIAAVDVRNNKRKRITAVNLNNAIHADDELKALFGRYLIAQGGTKSKQNKVFAANRRARKEKRLKAQAAREDRKKQDEAEESAGSDSDSDE